MKTIAWITFVLFIIAGIAFSVLFWNTNPLIGFLIVVLGFVMAFIEVAFIMIYLEMAEDIKAICNNTQNKNE